MPHTQLTRHALATLAYRLAKVVRETPADFGDFHPELPGQKLRTPGQILAHMGDLMDWGLARVEGRKDWHNSDPLPWHDETARFFRSIETLDQRIAAQGVEGQVAEKLIQSAIADALTHTGQIALLRRMAGIPVRGENYAMAEISAGCVGIDQPAPRLEFD
jgi:hypothetical protein